jgi:hypothetical protein
MMESVNRRALRKALTSIVNERGMNLGCEDIEALIRAAVASTEWMDSDQIATFAGRTGAASATDWCHKYKVERHLLSRREDVEAGKGRMPGQGARTDLIKREPA